MKNNEYVMWYITSFYPPSPSTTTTPTACCSQGAVQVAARIGLATKGRKWIMP
jgi:hypothetical protein